MNKTLLSLAVVSALMAGAGLASAQTTTTTTTTWTTDQGPVMREYYTTRKLPTFNDVSITPTIGQPLPNTVEVYPLPDTMKIESPDRYSYSVINGRPVVVERTTRKVVRTWD